MKGIEEIKEQETGLEIIFKNKFGNKEICYVKDISKCEIKKTDYYADYEEKNKVDV